VRLPRVGRSVGSPVETSAKQPNRLTPPRQEPFAGDTRAAHVFAPPQLSQPTRLRRQKGNILNEACYFPLTMPVAWRTITLVENYAPRPRNANLPIGAIESQTLEISALANLFVAIPPAFAHHLCPETQSWEPPAGEIFYSTHEPRQ